MKYLEKRVSLNGNEYKVVMLPCGQIRFFVQSAYAWRTLYTAPVIARITAALVDADHEEAIADNADDTAALNALKDADSMIKAAGVLNAAPLVEYLNDGKSRRVNNIRLWLNADVLASLIINAAANCFQGETPDTLDENGFDDMAQAIDRYVASAIDAWSQVEWESCHTIDNRAELARLAEMAKGHVIASAEMDSAKVCNACACLVANDDADMFSNSFTETNARKGIIAWSNEWNTLSIDHDKTDRDVSFNCECCGERIHGERFTLVLANFRN